MSERTSHTRAQDLVRALLSERIGDAARRLPADEPFADAGVASIDVVAVIAAIESRATTVDPTGPAELAEVGRSVQTVACYGVSIGAVT